MKKLTAIVLTLTMLLSMLVLPMGVTATEMTEAERQEMLNAVNVEYLDITAIENAFVRQAYGYLEQKAYDKGLQKNLTFDRTDTNPTFSRLVNTNFWNNMGAMGAHNPAVNTTSHMVKYYDLTTGIDSGVLTLAETKTVNGTVGVKDETTGLFSKQDAQYDVYTYFLNGVNGKYKIGPVAEPNKDADGNWGDDVYSTTGAYVVVGAIDKENDGVVNNKYTVVDKYTQQATTTSESQSYAKLLNINKKANFVNILYSLVSLGNDNKADAVLVPITVNYDSGKKEAYVLDTKDTVADPMSVVLAVKNNEDGSAHTATELDAAYTNQNYLTSAVKLESLGMTGVKLTDASIAGGTVLVAAKTPRIGTQINRNAKAATADGDGNGIYTTTISEVNKGEYKFYPSDFSIPVDSTKTISSVSISATNDPANYVSEFGLTKAGTGTYYYYIPVTFDAYKGNEYSFYIRLTRITANNAAILGMTLSRKSHNAVISEVNAKILAATTIEELEAANAEINAYVAENDIVKRDDFDVEAINSKAAGVIDNEIKAATTVTELEEIDAELDACAVSLGLDVTAFKATVAAKIEKLERTEELSNAYITMDIELIHDVFATDNDLSNANWAKISKATEPNIFAYKGFNISNGTSYPTNTSTNTSARGTSYAAFKVSKLDATEGIANKDGNYLFTIGNIPYKLGDIKKTDGQKGKNAWILNTKYDTALYSGEPALNTAPTSGNGNSIYTTGTYNQKGKFIINKAGLSSVNFLMGKLLHNNGQLSFARMNVKYAEDSQTTTKVLVPGTNKGNIMKHMYLIPVSDYNDIAEDDSLVADMKKFNKTPSSSEIKLEELQELDPTITALPTGGNYWDSTTGLTNAYNTYLAKAKYTKAREKSKSIETLAPDLDVTKFASRTGTEIIFADVTKQFVDFGNVRSTTTINEYDSYVHNLTLETDPDKTLEYVQIDGAQEDSGALVEESGGWCKISRYNVTTGMLMLSYEGKDTITIDETEYYIYADFERNCSDIALYGITLELNETPADLIANVETQLQNAVTYEECVEALKAMEELIASSNGSILESDFDVALVAKVRAEIYETLSLKKNLPVSVANGANAKFFMEYETWKAYYKINDASAEEWVIGLDYVGLANVDTSEETGNAKQYPSYPTGKDTDTVSGGYNNALLYKIDQTPGSGQWGVQFVNLTTKGDVKTWNVDGKEFVINPLEKVVKVYSRTYTDNVENLDLKARFATLNNPALDIEDGYYDSITVLAGVTTNRKLVPTVVYEDGTTKKLPEILVERVAYTAETNDGQEDGYMLLQTLTKWDNTNAGGVFDFRTVTITGFDTTQKIDKIIFETDGWGSAVYVISAFGETTTISEILASADANDYNSALAAIAKVDAILTENNIEVSDLKAESAEKYNELKAATAVLIINEVSFENNVVTVNYVNERIEDVKAVLLVVQYNAEETELVSVKKHPVTFTTTDTTLTQAVEVDANNKVKVLIWKDLIDFFPLTANIYNK